MTLGEARDFVARWQLAGPALEQARRDELRGFRHQERAQEIDDLLAAGLLHATPRASSGLVEMQRLFARARR